MKYTSLLLVAGVLLACSAHAQNSAHAQVVRNHISLRADRGLIALYDFADSEGDVVQDRSGVGEPLHLKIDKRDQVDRVSGSLTMKGATVIHSDGPAKKILDGVKRSGAISIEAWVQSAKLQQSGPARIVTLSRNTVERNFTLGQDNDRFDIRLRSDKTDSKGLPSLASPSKSLTTELTHIVYVRARDGATRIHINGREVSSGQTSGDVSNWGHDFHLALGNELTGDRPWHGTFYLVAIYNNALSDAEIKSFFAEGIKATIEKTRRIPPKLEPPSESQAKPGGQRVAKGLQLLYDFADGSGDRLRDRSGAGKPLDLTIGDLNAVRRRAGQLEIRSNTVIQSAQPATRLIESIKRARAITVEAWITPDNTSQNGPARVVTLSKDSNSRNVTVGQDGNHFEVRLRTTATSSNGIPSLSTPDKSVKKEPTHLIYTRSRGGTARIFINGEMVATAAVSGELGNWDKNFHFGLANELNQGRPWLGVYHLVALYNRDLSAREVKQNYRAGANGTTRTEVLLAKSPNAHLFESKIASLLSNHCLECHDTASAAGGLNLSRKSPALIGGESGKAIVAKNASDSLVWQAVDSDEMPQDRPPLSKQEKQLLKQWIDGGATWSIDFIDPANYTHEGRSNENWIQRLTVSEYINTVRATLGVDIETEARKILPPDVRADGFANTAYNLNVDLQHVDAYARLAEIVVSRMNTRKFAKNFQNRLSLIDDDMRGLIREMGRWILRGPLEENEVVLFRGVSTTVASAGGDVDEAIGYVIQAMLQSPRFIYRIENQRGDGDAWNVGEYELASRISYIVWGGPPDQQLYDAAQSGRLSDLAEVESQVRRMLADPRASERSAEFISEWLDLGRLENLVPEQKRFPKWQPQLAADMRAETLALFNDVVWKQKKPLADLLSAQVTYLTPALAQHYGLKPKGDGLQRYELSHESGRRGLMTHGSVLTVGGDDASMVTRGLLVLHELLRGVVKDPPPCVNTTPVPTGPGLTQRAIAEDRLKNESCGGCHSKFEPLAFGLEKFDGLGTHREQDEHGNQLREDGDVLIPGEAKPTRYKTSGELMDLLAASERVRESLTWKLTQFAIGRPMLAQDAPIVGDIHKTAAKNGGTYQATVSAIVLSDLVQKMRTESQ